MIAYLVQKTRMSSASLRGKSRGKRDVYAFIQFIKIFLQQIETLKEKHKIIDVPLLHRPASSHFREKHKIIDDLYIVSKLPLI
jgi:hypothetical protein